MFQIVFATKCSLPGSVGKTSLPRPGLHWPGIARSSGNSSPELFLIRESWITYVSIPADNEYSILIRAAKDTDVRCVAAKYGFYRTSGYDCLDSGMIHFDKSEEAVISISPQADRSLKIESSAFDFKNADGASGRASVLTAENANIFDLKTGKMFLLLFLAGILLLAAVFGALIFIMYKTVKKKRKYSVSGYLRE